MKITTRHTWLIALALLVGAGPAGCSNNDNNKKIVVNPPPTNNMTGDMGGNNTNGDMGGTNNTTNNTTGGDMGGDMSDMGGNTTNNTTGGDCAQGCDAGKTCDQFTQMCVTDSCAAGEDKGQLTVGMTATFAGANTDAGDVFSAGCSMGGARRPEKVYKFTVDKNARGKLTITKDDANVNWAYEIREGGCGDGTATFCSVPSLNSPRTFELYAGKEYFLVVEPNVSGTGSFEMTLELEPLACPPNSLVCNTGDNTKIDQCSPSGVQYDVRTCAGTCGAAKCAGGDCCSGDTPENPITIDVSSLSAQTFTGSPKGYTSVVNFQDYPFSQDETGTLPDCAPLESRHFDLFFELKNVKKNDIITIDAHNEPADDRPADRNANVFYILEGAPQVGMNAPLCVGHKNSNFPEVFTWKAHAAGDFILVIDTSSPNPDSFTYRVCKGDCPTYTP